MANIPVHPPAYDKNDPQGTVKKLCEYNVRLQEQLQFILTQMEKQIQKQGGQ